MIGTKCGADSSPVVRITSRTFQMRERFTSRSLPGAALPAHASCMLSNSARRNADRYFRMIARRVHDVHEIVDERLVDVNRSDAFLQLGDFMSLEDWLEMLERFLRATRAKELLLVDRVRISDRQLHQKTIE